MQRSFLKSLIIAVVTALSLTLLPSAFAQGITSAALNGLVTDSAGKAIGGAMVTVRHEPSGTVATTATRPTGQYTLSGLRVGGPYTVTIGNVGEYKGDSRPDLYLELDQSNTADFVLSSEVIKLEKFTVIGSQDTTFTSEKTSNSQSFSANEIAGTPMIRRDVQDVAIQDSRLSLTPNTSTGEYQLNAPGQNFRYNSFLVDGVQTNDAFGLNGNGFSSLRSPVPVDAIQAMSIDLSPYDVRRSGFTGALINAVIKSGTNQYHGSIYGFYTSQDLRGENPLTKKKDTFNERTFGLTGSGPLIKDKLFFFVAYENFHRTAASPASVFVPDAATLKLVTDKLMSGYNYDAGAVNADQTSDQKSYLAKLDWNISGAQRLSFTYRRTDGTSPIYADYQSFSNNSAVVNGEVVLSSGYQTSLSNHWYQQPRITDSYTLQLNSNWTPDFRTEAVVAYMKYNGSPKNNGAPFPELVFGSFPGTDIQTGASVTGNVFGGTERSRQYNFIDTKTLNVNLFGEYSLDKHTLTFGADMQNDDITNLFIQYLLGRYTFSMVPTSPVYFLNPAPLGTVRQAFLYGLSARQATTLGIPQPAPDYTNAETSALFSMMNVGVYAQDVWRPTKNLTLNAGVRMDTPLMSDRPQAVRTRGNASAPTATVSTTSFAEAGYEYKGQAVTTNTTNNDGNRTIAPRIGFNYKLPTKAKAQIRGGIGVFQGRNPTVWLSNMFSNTGAASNTTPSSTTTPPDNPVAFSPVVSLQTRVISQSVNVTDPNFKQPVSLKGNLAVDYTLPVGGLVASFNVDRAWTLQAPFVVDLNTGGVASTLSSTLPDGRYRYGSVRTTAKAIYGNVLFLTDTKNGGAESYTFALRRPMKNNWAYSISYTHSHSTEVSPMTSSVAFSNWSQRAIVNPNEDKAGISNYNTPDKIVVNVAHTFDFFNRKDTATTAAVSYRGQTGHNYSWVFYNDVNGDGNGSGAYDQFYMPSDADLTSGKVTFAVAAQKDAFLAYAKSVGLDKYAGQIVPRNSFVSKWQDTVDLHFSQQLPLSPKFGVEVYLDVINFANMLDKSMGIVEGVDFGYVRGIMNGVSNATGTSYAYTFGQVQPMQIYTELSRWQVQLGARIKF